MKGLNFSRRDVLAGSSALVAASAFSTRVMSAAPPASAVTPQLIEAAKKEGKVVWYTSIDLPLAEKIEVLRGQISRRFRARRAHRRRARVPAHRPGIWQQHPCR